MATCFSGGICIYEAVCVKLDVRGTREWHMRQDGTWRIAVLLVKVAAWYAGIATMEVINLPGMSEYFCKILLVQCWHLQQHNQFCPLKQLAKLGNSSAPLCFSLSLHSTSSVHRIRTFSSSSSPLFDKGGKCCIALSIVLHEKWRICCCRRQGKNLRENEFSLYLVTGLQNSIALFSLCGPQFSATFVNVSGPFYVSDKNTKREIVSMFSECIVRVFPMLQSAPAM